METKKNRKLSIKWQNVTVNQKYYNQTSFQKVKRQTVKIVRNDRVKRQQRQTQIAEFYENSRQFSYFVVLKKFERFFLIR